MSLAAHVAVRLGSLDLDVELDIAPGEVVALLGPNGAGKTTVLRALAGLVPLDAGRIAIDGSAVDDPSADVFVEPQQRPIGVVFQDYLLFAHLSVVENVAFGLRARGVSRSGSRSTARSWLDRLGLSAYADERPRSLSGGQAQRVALARALATSPRLLLLDEPLAALDVGTRATVRRDLRDHLRTFVGMRLLVTHDPVDAHALADRVAVVEQGRIVQAGTLAEVAARPRSRYVAELVGVNLVTGVVQGGADRGVLVTASGTRVVVADAEPGPACAVIRPHSVALTKDAPVGSSARNVWVGTIVDIDRLGDRARVTVDGAMPLTAEITIAALDALTLRPGDEVHAAVKATEVEVSPA
jgi:molybdate transport system ATP-binding protein